MARRIIQIVFSIGGLFLLIGLPGTIDDLKDWRDWLKTLGDLLDLNLPRVILMVVGAAMIIAVNVPPQKWRVVGRVIGAGLESRGERRQLENAGYSGREIRRLQILNRLEDYRALGVAIRNEGAQITEEELVQGWIVRMDRWRDECAAVIRKLSPVDASNFRILNRFRPSFQFKPVTAEHGLKLSVLEEHLRRLEGIMAEHNVSG